MIVLPTCQQYNRPVKYYTISKRKPFSWYWTANKRYGDETALAAIAKPIREEHACMQRRGRQFVTDNRVFNITANDSKLYIEVKT
jgi:hypothetical protein